MLLNQKSLLAALYALTSKLGICEDHLLDQKAQQVKAQHFPKTGSPLQDIPSKGW
jgi:hypothetical protein